MTKEQIEEGKALLSDIETAEDYLSSLEDAKAITTSTGTYYIGLGVGINVPASRETRDAIIDLIARDMKTHLSKLEEELKKL